MKQMYPEAIWHMIRVKSLSGFLSMLGVLLCMACEPNEQNLNIPDQQRRIVVECYLTPGHRPELALVESNTLDDDMVIRNIWYADVSIDIDGVRQPMKNILYVNQDRYMMVNYCADDTLQLNENRHFALSLTTRNKQEQLSAETSVVAPIHITNCQITDRRVDIGYFSEGDTAKYLKVGIIAFQEKGQYIESMYFDTRQQPAGSVTMFWKRPSSPIDSIAVSLFNIQKDYYDYGTSLQNAVSAYYDPILTPETIKSNIIGGVGIFTYYTFDRYISY